MNVKFRNSSLPFFLHIRYFSISKYHQLLHFIFSTGIQFSITKLVPSTGYHSKQNIKDLSLRSSLSLRGSVTPLRDSTLLLGTSGLLCVIVMGWQKYMWACGFSRSVYITVEFLTLRFGWLQMLCKLMGQFIISLWHANSSILHYYYVLTRSCPQPSWHQGLISQITLFPGTRMGRWFKSITFIMCFIFIIITLTSPQTIRHYIWEVVRPLL